ncbi:MAG: hypothetical protein IIX68_02985 [Clostridia bacterium]|nr:hypothetical protein [Clostridia bacterium]
MSVWFNNIHAFTVKITCNRDNINGNLYPVQGNGRTAGNPSIVPLGSNYTPFSGDVATFCFWALIPMLALLGVLSVTVLLSKKKQH